MNYKKQTSISSFFSETAEVPEKKKKTESQDQKKKYEDKRVRGWVSTWPMKFPGLVNTDRGMVCTFCRQFPALAGDTVMVTGCKSYRVESLCGHFSSQTHMRCVKAAAVQKRIEAGRCAGPLDQIVNKLGEHHYSLVKKLFNTAYCVVVNEMPFTTFPNLLKLQIKNGSDLDQLISYQSDKACARCVSLIN
ncbi:uncharacterized protein LOC106154070 [Lingula anatina]|uniref:Uncharacterized protein LOC106154070 n=1 Tax=Lingula anatina TaxID=7574 RepID=A0A1S3HCQ0_LINAN|nr:uncharacterized protein LOC106154070 [Lingula anatina]|eukprot:XP_013383760.1 uncharacterized protein LOC106154070 [Lingula anatina]